VTERAAALESQNPHLPAAAPAGLLSRKITGEVIRGVAPKDRESERLSSTFRDSHWMQGSPLPKEEGNPPRVSHTIKF
jgi:hypothetical protein